MQDISPSCLRRILTCLLPLGLASSASLGLNLVESSHFSSLPGEEGEARCKSVLWIRSAAQNTQIQAFSQQNFCSQHRNCCSASGVASLRVSGRAGKYFRFFPHASDSVRCFVPGFPWPAPTLGRNCANLAAEALIPVPAAVSWSLPGWTASCSMETKQQSLWDRAACLESLSLLQRGFFGRKPRDPAGQVLLLSLSPANPISSPPSHLLSTFAASCSISGSLRGDFLSKIFF